MFTCNYSGLLQIMSSSGRPIIKQDLLLNVHRGHYFHETPVKVSQGHVLVLTVFSIQCHCLGLKSILKSKSGLMKS